MDYAFANSLNTLGGILLCLLLYDISCQYSVWLKKRFGEAPSLALPEALVLVFGIGAMHVHGHKSECYARYAPTYIEGAGEVSGEGIESLWSTVNHVFPSTRTMTFAHRQEVIDDHILDSNWKKMVKLSE